MVLTYFLHLFTVFESAPSNLQLFDFNNGFDMYCVGLHLFRNEGEHKHKQNCLAFNLRQQMINGHDEMCKDCICNFNTTLKLPFLIC